MFQQPESVKKFHRIYLTTILMLVIALITLLTMAFKPMHGVRPIKPEPLIVPLMNNVVHNVGVDFETEEPIVIDALTGRKISPCRQLDGSDYKKSEKKPETICTTQVKIGPDGDYQLFDAKTHKRIKSRTVKAVFVLWEGSSCNTTYAGGHQYETCQSLDAKCRVLKMRGISHPACN